MMKKKLLCALLGGVMMISTIGCGGSGEEESGKGEVRFLNFKAEATEAWEELGEAFTEETGIEVQVITAPGGGEYESTLKAEIAKKEAPTLFQINGPVGYEAWKGYTADLTDTEFYKNLSDQNLAIKGEDGGVYGIPYSVEAFGIVYNQEVFDKYFELDGAKISSVDEIVNFDILSSVVEDMQSRKDEIGIEGVFGSTSLAPGEEWRWHTHLANLPIYYEYNDNDANSLDEIEFTYNEEFKNIFDLYINNSTVEPKLLGSKTVMDSVTEFALGDVAMIQNGKWVWEQISDTAGNVVKEDKIGFLPIYSGMEGEEEIGLHVGTENYFSVNSQASEADQQATKDFLDWLITSEIGKDTMVNELGNAAPFTTFAEDERPQDPLTKIMLESTESGKVSIPWSFQTFPGQNFKDDFGGGLLEYVQGTKSWDEVVETVKESWKTETEAMK